MNRSSLRFIKQHFTERSMIGDLSYYANDRKRHLDIIDEEMTRSDYKQRRLNTWHTECLPTGGSRMYNTGSSENGDHDNDLATMREQNCVAQSRIEEAMRDNQRLRHENETLNGCLHDLQQHMTSLECKQTRMQDTIGEQEREIRELKKNICSKQAELQRFHSAEGNDLRWVKRYKEMVDTEKKKNVEYEKNLWYMNNQIQRLQETMHASKRMHCD